MAVFPKTPLNTSPVHRTLRSRPALFGIPFVLIIVGASYGLSNFTQTRYDLADQKIRQMNKEEELGLKKDRRKFDIREEYFRLSAQPEEEWENKRIARPAGLPEWGVAPSDDSSASPPSSK